MADESKKDKLLRRALESIKALKSQLQEQSSPVFEPIAIIGQACRFPGANQVDDFLENLNQGVNSVTTRSNLITDEIKELGAHHVIQRGGFIDDPLAFDAGHFNISPREAHYIDPQHRVLLEMVWHAFEDAGVPPSSQYKQPVGVYIGISTFDYSGLLGEKLPKESYSSYMGTGNSHSAAAGRVSYHFGFTGPAMAIDTACSSSLVALHTACQSLRQSECNLAVVGGVNLILAPNTSLVFSNAKMLSDDGQCKTFDNSADGYVRGEGCGVILIKRLSKALADGDQILSVIKGSSINQDGRSGGFTVPNGLSQQAVVNLALKQAQLTTEDVDFVESHGTGTPLGDPIELNALQRVFEKREESLQVGSVKGNIGHLEAAAGIAGVIKAAHVSRTGCVPGQLNFGSPTKQFDWQAGKLEVATKLTKLSPKSHYVAGVSSFGFTGTNSHIILEGSPRILVEQEQHSPKVERSLASEVLTYSASSAESLASLEIDLRNYLQKNASFDWQDVCHAAAVTRDHLGFRGAIAATSREDAIGVLNNVIEHSSLKTRSAVDLSKHAWVFSGQGSQQPGMGRYLYDNHPECAAIFDECEAINLSLFSESLLAVLLNRDGEGEKVHQTEYTQPALFVLQVALATLWEKRGLTPRFVVGHSVGQYAAACVAGVFSVADGFTLVAHRGRLMRSLTQPGAMLALSTSVEECSSILEALEDKWALDIAAINSPEQTVVAGDAEAISALADYLDQSKTRVIYTRLNVSHAFHSRLMKPMLNDFEQVANSISYQTPTIFVVCNVSGELEKSALASPSYWVKHVIAAVNFRQGMRTLLDRGVNTFLEIGPTKAIAQLIRANDPERKGKVFSCESRFGTQRVLDCNEALAGLYQEGFDFDWRNVFREPLDHHVKLPLYPFIRERFGIDGVPGIRDTSSVDTESKVADEGTRPNVQGVLHPLVHRNTSVLAQQRFSSRFTGNEFFLADHQINGQCVLPGVAYLELVRAGLELSMDKQATGSGVRFNNVVWVSPIVLQQGQFVDVDVRFGESGNNTIEFEVYSESTGNSKAVIHAQGVAFFSPVSRKLPPLDISLIKSQCNKQLVTAEQCYQIFVTKGFSYGKAFQGLECIYVSENLVLAKLSIPSCVGDTLNDYVLHPSLLDSALQASASLMASAQQSIELSQIKPLIPYALREIEILSKCSSNMWAVLQYSKGSSRGGGVNKIDIDLCDEQGSVCARMKAYTPRELSADASTESRMSPMENTGKEFDVQSYVNIFNKISNDGLSKNQFKELINEQMDR